MRNGFGTATPPGVFPPILGLFGLGLGWRRAAEVTGAPDWIGEIVLGAVTLAFLYAAAAYLTKIARRPAAFAEDLHVLPGRAGLSAASLAGMLLAATLAPYGPGAARIVLGLAIANHAIVAAAILRDFWGAPFLHRRMTPVWHLSFVGFIVAPVAAIPLGWTGLAALVTILTTPMAVTIWVFSALILWRAGMPAPLRPVLAIHLGPASLIGLAAVGLGWTALAWTMAGLALAIALLLVLRLRYLTEGGFSPFWGAFTFPMAAFANLMLALAPQSDLLRLIGALTLMAASGFIPWVAWRILRLWMSGQLALKGNAARADGKKPPRGAFQSGGRMK